MSQLFFFCKYLISFFEKSIAFSRRVFILMGVSFSWWARGGARGREEKLNEVVRNLAKTWVEPFRVLGTPRKFNLFCGSFFVSSSTFFSVIPYLLWNLASGNQKYKEFELLFYACLTRTSRKRNRSPQISQCPSRERKSMGNLVAEKTRDHRHDVFRHDPRLLVTRQWSTIPECDRPYSWLYAFDTVDGVDEKVIS